MASPKNTENTISGNIAPSAAALTGLTGTRSVSHWAKEGIFFTLSLAAVAAVAPLSRSDATAAASSGIIAMSGGATRAANVAATVSTMRKRISARDPMRPMVRASGADVTPTMMLPTTRGTTVMRMALIQSVPSGSTMGTIMDSVGFCASEMPMPTAIPATSAMRTFVVRDTRPNYRSDVSDASRWARRLRQLEHRYGRQRMLMKTATDLIDEAKERITEVTPQQTMRICSEHPSTVVIDCREPNEWNLGRVPGATFLPRGTLETNIEAVVSREQKVIIYCASGNRSALAADTLQQMGYVDVASMSGGFRGWAEAGGDIDG